MQRLESALQELIERAVSREVERQVAKLKPEPLSPFMNVPEAAEFLCCKPQRVHDLISQGRLSRHKEGGRTLVLRAEVEALVEKTSEQASWTLLSRDVA